MRRHAILLLLLLILPDGIFAATAKNAKNIANDNDTLVQWLQQGGGFFSDKMKIGSSEGQRNGVFAVEAIKKGEVLLKVPHSLLLRASDGDLTPNYSVDMCDLTWNLVHQYYLNDKSKWSTYIDYILGHMRNGGSSKHHLPSDFSDESLDILHDILGKEMTEPLSLTSLFFDAIDYTETCPDHDLRHFQTLLLKETQTKIITPQELFDVTQEAWRQIISRSWNEVLVPMLDMFNHRNDGTSDQHWHNVDQQTSVHTPGVDLVVVALRDIQAGEQLHNSYNECHDSDCEGLELEYVLPQIFKDYGFVEQTPQRWRFDFGSEEEEDERFQDDETLIFEVDTVKDTDELTLTWLSEPPNLSRFHWFHGHLQRLRKLLPSLQEQLQPNSAATPQQASERETLHTFLEAFTHALELVVQHTDATFKFTDLKEETQFDDLQVHGIQPGLPLAPNQEETEWEVCSGGSDFRGDTEYHKIGDTTSFYQNIRFEFNPAIGDTCLYLSSWLQTCTSWRAHYHESVVHYPSRFLKHVKRVIYLGGGDNMLLHEILKYPSLELVMGMELDQAVVRQSFQHLGTQPHFDNPKVQWWFGDATKSLSMLLEGQGSDFYGTFDLVIVDLQTNVAETLMVTSTATIMDVAMQLLAPHGVLARNEDFYPRRSVGFAKYEVDLEFLDVPQLCQQSITIGSTNVDFLTHDLTGHGVPTVYLNVSSLDDGTDKYARWLNYRNNDDVPNPSPMCDGKSDENDNDSNERGFGVHMILEVEDTPVAREQPKVIMKVVREIVEKVGLTDIGVNYAPNNDGLFVVLLVQGYVTVQIFQEELYIALDVKLFSQFGKLEPARELLVSMLSRGSNELSSSSLRVVTGGMFGVPKGSSNSSKEAPTCADNGSLDAATVEKIDDFAAMTIIQKATTLGSNAQPVVAVLCGNDESACASIKALRKGKFKQLLPLLACTDTSDTEKMATCASQTKASLLNSVEKSGKIDRLLIDASTPKAMGQILHKMLRDKRVKSTLVNEAYAVMAFSDVPSTSSWQEALLERFQTEFDIHTPAQRSSLQFKSKSNTFNIDLFWTSDNSIFGDVAVLLNEIEKKTKLIGQLRKVNDGVLKYAADFTPNVVGSTSDFDREDAKKQWANQDSLGHQSILQFEIQAAQSPLNAGEAVLFNYEQDVWKGEWSLGTVVTELEDGQYKVGFYNGEEREVSRDTLRRFENKSPLEVRQPVLVHRGGFWTQGAVIEQLEEDGMFRIRGYDSDGDVLTVHRTNLVPRFEPPDAEETPILSCRLVHEALSTALEKQEIDTSIVEGDDAKDPMSPHTFQVSNGFAAGCTITAFWPEGHAVTTWDGRGHVDVSVFTSEENDEMRTSLIGTIKEELPYLKLTAHDEMPRGTGRVVIFNSESEEEPYWTLEE